MQDALDDEWDPVPRGHVTDVCPAEAGVDQGLCPVRFERTVQPGSSHRRHLVPHRVPRAQVALAPTRDGKVDGHHQCAATGRESRLDEVVCQGAIGENVHLEPPTRARDRVRDVGRRHRRERRQAHGGRRAGSSPSHGDLAVRGGEALVRHRGGDDRVGHGLAQHVRGGVYPAGAGENPRDDGEAPPGCQVGGERPLVHGSAGEVAELAGPERRASRGLEVGKSGGEVGVAHAGSPTSRTAAG